jgi:hypothetical protein
MRRPTVGYHKDGVSALLRHVPLQLGDVPVRLGKVLLSRIDSP